MRIDAHAHVFGATTGGDPRGVDALAPAERTAPVDELLELMDANGIDRAVLVALDNADEAVTQAARMHPGRFATVAVAAAGESTRSLRNRRDAAGFAAVRMMWLGDPGRAADSPMLPLLRWLASEGLPLWSYLGPEQLPLLPDLLDLVPDLTVVLNHVGFTPHDMIVDADRRPTFAEAFTPAGLDIVDRLADRDGVHLLVSGQYALSAEDPPYADLDPVIARLVGRFGADRCLWGSDFPWPVVRPGYGSLLAATESVLRGACGLSDAELADVFGGTAARLFSAAPW